MKKLLTIALISCFLTSSCASMFSGTKETITIKSDVRGTEIYVDENKVGTDSATVVVPKKKLKSTVIKGKKSGCADKTSGIPTSFDPATLLGLFIDFGIITILMIDGLATGAVTEAAQTFVDITPNCSK